MSKQKTISLSFDSGGSFDSILVTPVRADVYRLEESPLVSEKASFGDEIEAEKDAKGRLCFRRVVSKSGLQTYRMLVAQRIVESDGFRAFCNRVKEAGGMWECACGGMVTIHIPEGSDIEPETEVKKLAEVLSTEPSG